ncbi:MAG: lipoprotein insertase outer membrane protein LolB [Gammaproteobacteria bacterium]
MRTVFVALLFSFSIVACTSQPSAPAGPTPVASATPAQALYERRQAIIGSIRTWSFRGRTAVQRGSEGWTATLHWRQHDGSFRLRIIAPLGQGTYEILREPDKVSLIDADNRVYTAATPEQLASEVIGWRLPITNIEYWVRGLMAPHEEPSQLTLDEGGLVKDFAVDRWRVSILEYQFIDDLAMPRKLFMSHGDTKIRVVINAWEIVTDERD